MTGTRPCPTCGHPTVAQHVYKTLPTPKPARPRATAAGECKVCWRKARVGVTVQRVPRHLVVLDWHWLHEVGELREDETLAERVRRAAPRIGVSETALFSALLSAGIRNPREDAAA